MIMIKIRSNLLFKPLLLILPLLLTLTACGGSASDDGTTDPPVDEITVPGDTSLPEPLRTIEAGPDNYRSQLSALQPGDWLQLSAGTYRDGLPLRDLTGSPEHPIVISGPTSGEPAVFLARSGANTVSLRNVAHVVIRHLHLDGQQLNVAGVVAEANSDWSHHITLEHLRIRNHDRSQGNTGITTRSPAWNWVIRHNDIRDVGTGLYLGRPDGSGPFIGGLIENNFIADTLGYNMQIKHQRVRDLVPGMPTEPRQTVIRYNVFSKAARASSGAQARPNLLVGHWPPQGPGADDQYLIYANLFHENPHERLFQGEGNVALYNNVLINSGGDGVILFRHNDRPKNVQILHNTIVAGGFGIRIDQPDPDAAQQVAGNAVFAVNPLVLDPAVETDSNYLNTFSSAPTLLTKITTDLAELDLYPRSQALRHGGAEVSAPPLPQLERDYNHRPRQPGWYGAYASGDAVNPGRPEGIGPRVAGSGIQPHLSLSPLQPEKR